MPQIENRITYEPYARHQDRHEWGEPGERYSEEITFRAQHLCSLGFMLRHFNPHDLTVTEDVRCSLSNYGDLIMQISEGLFSPADELNTLVEQVTTFTETKQETR